MDLKTIKDLMEALEESKVVEFEYQDDDVHLVLKKKEAFVSENIITQTGSLPEVQVSSQQQIQTTEESSDANTELKQNDGLTEIKSPMVATFYKAPSPTSPPYVEIGDSVKKGDTLCILEAMKIMNELEAEFPCTIEKVLVKDGEKVEFDQPLFLVKKLD